jgi:hypothetical protein
LRLNFSTSNLELALSPLAKKLPKPFLVKSSPLYGKIALYFNIEPKTNGEKVLKNI